ncbi:phenylalanine--tRNA ligase subunit beta [Mycoplasma sp. HF14]
MLISLNRLNKMFPKMTLTAEQVEKTLNSIGFEVEEVKKFSNVKGLLFCEVLSVKQNPNSDRLDIVEVKTKQGNYTIQTNNRILKPGDLTICFPVGASKGDMTFGEVELKGYLSQGMFGAWSEIGYDWTLLAHKDQIVTFDPSFATIEDDPIAKLGLDDFMIEISITANRNDANSYYVIAKELAAYYNTEVKEINYSNNEAGLPLSYEIEFNSENKAIQDVIYLKTNNDLHCSLEDKLLLAKHGFDTKVANAYNLANLTLILTGVPVQVYDYSSLPSSEDLGKNLSLKKYSGKVTLQCEKEVEVKDVLTVFASNKPVALAGVCVLDKYQAKEDSTEVVFEFGPFDPSEVRRTLREIKTSNPAAAQASRPITKASVLFAVKYFVSEILLKDQNHKNAKDLYGIEEKVIPYDENKLFIYGGNLKPEKLNKAYESLVSLGFSFSKDNDLIYVPAYRYDVNVMEDVIEEVLRFYSYDGIKEEVLPSVPLKTMKFNPIPGNFVAQGYNEVRTFTLVSQEKAQFNPFNFATNQTLLTYVSKEREVVRNSIVTSLAGVVEYNLKRKMTDLNIFEKGMINNNVMVYGVASTTKTFRQMQMDLINITGKELKFVPLADNEMIHPNVSAEIIYQDKMVGWIGKIHPKYDVTNGALYAEILVDVFGNNNKEIKFNAVNLEPLKTLDITFELDENDYVSTALDFVNQIPNAEAELKSIKVIDQFKKDNKVNTTVRFLGSDEIITLIDAKFNKKGE